MEVMAYSHSSSPHQLPTQPYRYGYGWAPHHSQGREFYRAPAYLFCEDLATSSLPERVEARPRTFGVGSFPRISWPFAGDVGCLIFALESSGKAACTPAP